MMMTLRFECDLDVIPRRLRGVVRRCLSVLLATVAVAGSAGAQTATLRLASTPWSPFTDIPGKPRFAIDLVQTALDRAGLAAEITIVEEGTLTRGLVEGQFDGSAALWKDPERERALIYSEAYFENRMILVGRHGTDVSFTTVAQLTGKRVSLVQGFAYGEEVTNVTGPVFVPAQSVEDSLNKLLDGAADYALMDNVVVQYVLEKFPQQARTRLAIGGAPLFVRTLHFAVRRSHPAAQAIVERFNNQLRGMVADRTYHRLLHLDWIEADVDGDGRRELVPDRNDIGPAAPERVYALFAGNRPAIVPASTRRFYLDGQIYEGWSNVPRRYKTTRNGEASTDTMGAPVFAFDWFVAETSHRETIPVSSLPFPVAFTDRARPVEQIVLSGVSLYDPRALLTYALAATGSKSGTLSAGSTAQAIRTLYKEDGYFLANATAEPEQFTGELEFFASEGRIGDVRIEGLRRKVASQVARYFQHVSGELPVRQDQFERALMLSSDLSGVDMLGEFSVSDHTRAASLRLVGTELRQAGSVTFDTVPLAPGTSYRSYLLQQFNSVIAGGDLLRVMVFGTLEPESTNSIVGTAFYRSPVGSHGTYIEARGGNSFARTEFREPDFLSRLNGTNWAVGAGHPVRRSLNQYLYAIGEYEYLTVRARLANERQTSQSNAGRLTMVYGYTPQHGGLVQVSASVAAGTSDDESLADPAEGSEAFAHARFAFGTLFPLGSRTSQRFEVFAQPMATRLPVVQQLFLGYGPYLRGYPPVEFSGERGVTGTAELSHVLVARASGKYEVVPYAFVDAGYATSGRLIAPYTVQSQSLASVGAGVRLRGAGGLAGNVWLGVPLADGAYTRSGDAKVGVQLTKGW